MSILRWVSLVMLSVGFISFFGGVNRVAALSYLVVSEVYYDPVGSEPAEEWIEIYNSTGASVNLESYRIGDEETQGGGEGMYAFPAGATIANNDVIVVSNRATAFIALYGFPPDYELVETDPTVPNLTRDTGWATGDISLSNSNDEVILLTYSGTAYTEIDRMEWGATPGGIICTDVVQGHSLERCPANSDTGVCDTDFVDQADPSTSVNTVCGPVTPTLTATPTPTGSRTITATPTTTFTPTVTLTPTVGSPTQTPPPVTGLLISEFLSNPSTGSSDDEWVEVFNATLNQSVAIAGLRIGDEETMGAGEGMYIIPEDALPLEPCGILLIASKATNFFTAYGFYPDYEFIESSPDVPTLAKDTAWANGSINLSNAGDEILMMNAAYTPVDAVSYGTGVYPNVTPHAAPTQGHSLERCPSNVDTNDCSLDFIEQTTHHPGEPCQVTCVPTTVTVTPTRTYTPTLTPTLSPTATRTSTPTPFYTATPTPTGTPPTLTPTTTPTLSPTMPPPTSTPTVTPTGSYIPNTPTITPSTTPTIVATSTPTRTNTPIPTNTPVPTTPPTYTPSCDLGVELTMPSHFFNCNDICFLHAKVCNPTDENKGSANLFVILEVYGMYYFWDAWTQDLSYSTITLTPFYMWEEDVIPEFYWPSSGAADNLKFYGALTDPDITTVIGNLSIWEFGFDC